MKKIMLVVLAMVGMCMASCGNGAAGEKAVNDSIIVGDTLEEVIDSVLSDSLICND